MGRRGVVRSDVGPHVARGRYLRRGVISLVGRFRSLWSGVLPHEAGCSRAAGRRSRGGSHVSGTTQTVQAISGEATSDRPIRGKEGSAASLPTAVRLRRCLSRLGSRVLCALVGLSLVLSLLVGPRVAYAAWVPMGDFEVTAAMLEAAFGWVAAGLTGISAGAMGAVGGVAAVGGYSLWAAENPEEASQFEQYLAENVDGKTAILQASRKIIDGHILGHVRQIGINRIHVVPWAFSFLLDESARNVGLLQLVDANVQALVVLPEPEADDEREEDQHGPKHNDHHSTSYQVMSSEKLKREPSRRGQAGGPQKGRTILDDHELLKVLDVVLDRAFGELAADERLAVPVAVANDDGEGVALALLQLAQLGEAARVVAADAILVCLIVLDDDCDGNFAILVGVLLQGTELNRDTVKFPTHNFFLAFNQSNKVTRL